jgi:hypothetical protein
MAPPPKKGAALLLMDEEEPEEASGEDAETQHGQDMLDAIEAKDPVALARAVKACAMADDYDDEGDD